MEEFKGTKDYGPIRYHVGAEFMNDGCYIGDGYTENKEGDWIKYEDFKTFSEITKINISDLEARLKEAVELIAQANIQIQYMQKKFKLTATGELMSAKIDSFLTKEKTK